MGSEMCIRDSIHRWIYCCPPCRSRLALQPHFAAFPLLPWNCCVVQLPVVLRSVTAGAKHHRCAHRGRWQRLLQRAQRGARVSPYPTRAHYSSLGAGVMPRRRSVLRPRTLRGRPAPSPPGMTIRLLLQARPCLPSPSLPSDIAFSAHAPQQNQHVVRPNPCAQTIMARTHQRVGSCNACTHDQAYQRGRGSADSAPAPVTRGRSPEASSLDAPGGTPGGEYH